MDCRAIPLVALLLWAAVSWAVTVPTADGTVFLHPDAGYTITFPTGWDVLEHDGTHDVAGWCVIGSLRTSHPVGLTVGTLVEDLWVKIITVDAGMTIKRSAPRAFGRASPIRKRTSHVLIKLTDEARPAAKATKRVYIPRAQRKPVAATK